MSDTANPPTLASTPLARAGEFDDRLKRTDEDRWLATRYADATGRELLVAIYLLNHELQRTLHTKEPMLGKIRLQWWRETLDQVGGAGALRRHDLAEELARVTARRADLMAPLGALVDAFDDILDDHLHAGGHQPGGEHEARHLAVEARLVRLAGLALMADAPEPELEAMGRVAEAALAMRAELPDAEARWDAARRRARALPSAMWPALLHLAARPDGKGREPSPFAKRWRMFSAALWRKL
jgi:phytoene synthase